MFLALTKSLLIVVSCSVPHLALILILAGVFWRESMSSIKHLEMPATWRLCAQFLMHVSISEFWPRALAFLYCSDHGVAQWDLGERVCLPRLLISGWIPAAAALCYLPAGLPLLTLGTNAAIISTIVLDRALHTPMYFFLLYSPVLRLYIPSSLYLRCWLICWSRRRQFLFWLCYPDVFLPL